MLGASGRARQRGLQLVVVLRLGQVAREAAAFAQLVALSGPVGVEMQELWREYEEQRTPEAIPVGLAEHVYRVVLKGV